MKRTRRKKRALKNATYLYNILIYIFLKECKTEKIDKKYDPTHLFLKGYKWSKEWYKKLDEEKGETNPEKTLPERVKLIPQKKKRKQKTKKNKQTNKKKQKENQIILKKVLYNTYHR